MSDLISPSTCKAIVAAIPDAALVVSRQKEIIAANTRANDVMNAVLEGQQVALFLRSPDVLRALADTLNENTFRQVDFVIPAKVFRMLHVEIAPLGKNKSGTLALVLLRDRTREQQIESMRSDFVANASHELRTPLTILAGFIDTMQGAAKNDEKAREEFLKLMKAQADRMSLLLDDLLSLSHIELEEHVAPNSIVNLSAVVHQTKNLLQSTVNDQQCELVIDMPKDLAVHGDANQLGQVVHNLIENAVKYSGVGKRVLVIGTPASGASGMAILRVEDNGPGIAAHHIPRLTERFYRANVQESRTRGGTGLGLAICKHIINRHNGRLEIESEVGKGSRFSVHLHAAR